MRNALPMGQTQLSRSATTLPPSLLLEPLPGPGTTARNNILSFIWLWFVVPILDCQTGVYWGPSISEVDLQGNLPCGDRIRQVDCVSRGDFQDVLRCHPLKFRQHRSHIPIFRWRRKSMIGPSEVRSVNSLLL